MLKFLLLLKNNNNLFVFFFGLISNLNLNWECYYRFIADLDQCWQSDIISFDISHIVYEHASKNFDVFVSYCKNHSNQERCLEQLKWVLFIALKYIINVIKVLPPLQ